MHKYDLIWKEILGEWLQEFTEFFWPAAYRDIDWSRGYESLEQELLNLNIKANNDRHVDKLFKVFLKNGDEQWLLLHIEIQQTKQNDFEKRMYIYFSRIYEKHDKDVASIAILADGNLTWRPNTFQRQVWNSSITRTFEVVKILDFRGQEEMLSTTNNPFGLIVLAQLIAIKTKPVQGERLVSKIELIKLLLQHKWEHEKIRKLFSWLDNLLILGEDFELEYVKEVNKLAEDNKMRLMNTLERHEFNDGMQQGVKQGMQQGMQDGMQYEALRILINLLTARFKELPEEYVIILKRASSEQLEIWATNFVNATTIDEVFKVYKKL